MASGNIHEAYSFLLDMPTHVQAACAEPRGPDARCAVLAPGTGGSHETPKMAGVVRMCWLDTRPIVAAKSGQPRFEGGQGG